MLRDEIIAEVWRLKDAYAKKCGNDLDKMLADLRKRQKHPFSKLVDRRKRRSTGLNTSIDRAALSGKQSS